MMDVAVQTVDITNKIIQEIIADYRVTSNL